MTEWQAYDTIDPVGAWRDDFRSAQICSLIDNIVKALYGKKGQTETSTVNDFMPDWTGEKKKAKESPKKQTVEEQKSVIMSIARAMKAKFVKKPKEEHE